jgi:hypothetical protein
MLITPTLALKKAYTPLPSLKALKGKGKEKRTICSSNNKDMVNTLEK